MGMQLCAHSTRSNVRIGRTLPYEVRICLLMDKQVW